MAWEDRMHLIKRNGESKLKQKLPTLASWDNGIKMNTVVLVVVTNIVHVLLVLLITISLTFLLQVTLSRMLHKWLMGLNVMPEVGITQIHTVTWGMLCHPRGLNIYFFSYEFFYRCWVYPELTNFFNV